MKDHSELTLRKQNDFNRVYKKGNSKGSKYVVILYNRNRLGYTRVAYVASKKVGNSVQRNRSRRMMREAYRSFGLNIRQGYDIIFVARNTIVDCKTEDVSRAMFGAVRAAGLFE